MKKIFIRPIRNFELIDSRCCQSILNITTLNNKILERRDLK